MTTLNDKDIENLGNIIDSIDTEQILRTAEHIRAMDIEMLRTAERFAAADKKMFELVNSLSSINLEPILLAANSMNSIYMEPIITAADMMSSIDIKSLINSIEGIDTVYINSLFLSPEIISSLKTEELDKDIKIAVPAREPIDGCKPAKNDFNFVSIDESEKELEDRNKLEIAIGKLENLLESECNDESEYQKLLKDNPWMFGHLYSEINSHKNFDDKNIPDFTGVRVTDNFNDIFEIKAPFIKLFGQNGEPLTLFHKAWAQIERYANFAEDNRNYLYHEKGLNFENPRIFLYIGYDLDEKKKKEIRKKERNSNLNVTVYTYDDLLKSAKNLLELYKKLFTDGENSK